MFPNKINFFLKDYNLCFQTLQIFLIVLFKFPNTPILYLSFNKIDRLRFTIKIESIKDFCLFSTNLGSFGPNGATTLRLKSGSGVRDLDWVDDVIVRNLNFVHLCVLTIVPRHCRFRLPVRILYSNRDLILLFLTKCNKLIYSSVLRAFLMVHYNFIYISL